ncbi:MAG: hypothetical protein K0R06_3148 [Clostridium sp.]|jgi:hypothetical protein|nr:hypothetical protein [Clostridium sp.]
MEFIERELEAGKVLKGSLREVPFGIVSLNFSKGQRESPL